MDSNNNKFFCPSSLSTASSSSSCSTGQEALQLGREQLVRRSSQQYLPSRNYITGRDNSSFINSFLNFNKNIITSCTKGARTEDCTGSSCRRITASKNKNCRRTRATSTISTTVMYFLVATFSLINIFFVEGNKNAAVPVLDVANIKNEDDARAKLDEGKIRENLKQLHADDIDFIVTHGYWALANELVDESHKQQGVDLSFAVRKAVQHVKKKADELVRHLNPKYHEAKKVIPVYRWSQNDTTIFITIKYAVKWDAPGAIDVSDESVEITDSGVVKFRAKGKHSGYKYEYSLDMDMFDKIDKQSSIWSSGSVGRYTLEISKSRSRRWPRLLINKKDKGTGRLDLTRQEILDKDMSTGNSVSQSEKTCAGLKKFFCPSKDSCVADCASCGDLNSPKDAFCSGKTKKPVKSVTFIDTDMRRDTIGGEIRIEQNLTEYDVDKYIMKIGKVKKGGDGADKKIEDQMSEYAVVAADGRSKEIKYTLSDVKPLKELGDDEEMNIAVFGSNSFGVVETPVFQKCEDAYYPESGPVSVSFHDTHGDSGTLSGDIKIEGPEDETIEEYAIYWGKGRQGRKLPSDAYIGSQKRATAGNGPTKYTLSAKSIPTGATHIVVFAKNQHGENSTNFALTAIVDNTKPCSGKDLASSVHCPASIVNTSEDTAPEANVISLALTLEDLKFPKDVNYAVFAASGPKCTGESNYKKLEISADSSNETKLVLSNVVLNDESESTKIKYTHLNVYTENVYGVSKHCVGVPLIDAGAPVEEQVEQAEATPKTEL